MSIFDHNRLTNAVFKLDIDGLRRGYYSDKYFENVVYVLNGAAMAGYTFGGSSPRAVPAAADTLPVGDAVVETQVFNRRAPQVLVAGVDMALALLRYCTGYFDDGAFIGSADQLEVLAVEDGVLTHYAGDPMHVQPVLKIRGRYRDFALLETPILGVLSHASRIATNVYELLAAAQGKQVLFFPARFDLPETQSVDGYAYWLAIQRHNRDRGQNLRPLASTDAGAAWWGGQGGGTVPHALIACFLADTAETMRAFARYVPVHVNRVALVDFNNDCIGASLAVLDAYWEQYCPALEAGDETEQQRWTLYGVRPDTAGEMRDIALPPDAPTGVSAPLIRTLREAMNTAWTRWHVPPKLEDAAKRFCQQVKIVASGGFSAERIRQFEADGVPVDVYGVGSTFLRNDARTNTDYTMDVVRIKIGRQWVDMAKTGRQPCDNPDLQPIDLSQL